MHKINNISEAFMTIDDLKNFSKKIFKSEPQEEDLNMLDLDKPEWKNELREVQSKFHKHTGHVNLGIVDHSSGVASNVQGKLHVGVTRNRTDQFFSIYVETTYVVFKLDLSKTGYSVFKAKNVIFPANTIGIILDAIKDIDNYTNWKNYDDVMHTTITRDLKLEPQIKQSR